MSSNAKLGVGEEGVVEKSSSSSRSVVVDSFETVSVDSLAPSDGGVSFVGEDTVEGTAGGGGGGGGVQNGEKAPVAEPGFKKNLLSDSNASNL